MERNIDKKIVPGSFQAWWLAARPKTLSGAAVPVLLGCALAVSDRCFRPGAALLCLMFAWLMQIDANLINDLFDFLKGADGEGRLGPRRACSQGWISLRQMKRGILLVTASAAAAGCALLLYGGWILVPVGLCCILFAWLYTAGPYPLAYHGWGDLLVIVFFGIVPVSCTYYVMSGNWDAEVFLTAVCCGAVVDTMLLVNNYRDLEQDRKNGKKTLAVRLGKERAGCLYWLAGAAGVCGCFYFLRTDRVWAGVFPLIYLLLHTFSWYRMVKIGGGRELNRILGETARNIFIFGVLLALGLLL